jgi:diaminopimelate epimerase
VSRRSQGDPLTGIVFFKMSGSGNDFVFVDGRAAPLALWTPDRIRAICARGTGVGADGFVVLEPGSRPGAVRFHFFNNDGGRAEMCGNGALCATRLSAWLELAPPTRMALETDAGTVVGRCVPGAGEQAEIDLPRAGAVTAPDIGLMDGERTMRLTAVGVPHLVVMVDDLARVRLEERGRELRHHPSLGPAGANVNFVANGGSAWGMRTYERGVEAETLACGTGAAAVALVLEDGGAVKMPCSIQTASGAVLTVAASEAPGVCRLRGEGRMVYRGILGE